MQILRKSSDMARHRNGLPALVELVTVPDSVPVVVAEDPVSDEPESPAVPSGSGQARRRARPARKPDTDDLKPDTDDFRD